MLRWTLTASIGCLCVAAYAYWAHDEISLLVNNARVLWEGTWRVGE